MRNRKCFGPYEAPVAWTDYQKRTASLFRRLFRRVRPDCLCEQLADPEIEARGALAKVWAADQRLIRSRNLDLRRQERAVLEAQRHSLLRELEALDRELVRLREGQLP